MALWGHLVKVNSSLSVLLKRWGGEEVAALFRGRCYLPVALGRPLGAFLPPPPAWSPGGQWLRVHGAVKGKPACPTGSVNLNYFPGQAAIILG